MTDSFSLNEVFDTIGTHAERLDEAMGAIAGSAKVPRQRRPRTARQVKRSVRVMHVVWQSKPL
jgi:hypothetical protein